MKADFLFFNMLFLALALTGCGEVRTGSEPIKGKEQADGNVQLMIGQDLNSIRGYVKSAKYPAPSGVTTYLSFYNLLSTSAPAYGGLGLDQRGYPTNKAVDWGAGPLNTLALAREYPQAALNIGLNIAEGNQSTVWVEGGLVAIARGEYDKEINHLAVFFRLINNPVYLRIGYEFDGAWNRGYDNTRQYIAAYKHIVDKLREKQVRNVAFVWQGSASPIDDILESKHEDITHWYPGDGYVDWVGLSWFLTPDKSVKGAKTQRELANELLRFARLKKKPVIIAEASPQGYDLNEMTQSNISSVWDGESGANKKPVTSAQVWQEWYAPFFTFIHNNKDVIKVVSYINADWDSQPLWSAPYSGGYWGDSRVQMNAEISKKWLLEVGNNAF